MWKNTVRPTEPQIIHYGAGKMRFTRRITKVRRTQKVKVKVKFTLEQATKVHRGSRGIAILF